jgi:hypothetical protein
MKEVSSSSVAIYYQRSKSVHEEFKLIELVTEREMFVEQLEILMKGGKLRRRQYDDDAILEAFQLLNSVRDVTIRLLKAIASWQNSFTKPLRPTLLQCDYMVAKMVKKMDFVDSSKIRTIFNFQFFRGNALLLPFPTLRDGSPIQVGQALSKEIRKFSSPPEADIIAGYQVLINSLPDDVYKGRLVSLEKWLLSPWVPRIWISNTNNKFFPVLKPSVNHAVAKPIAAPVEEDDKVRSAKHSSNEKEMKEPVLQPQQQQPAETCPRLGRSSMIQPALKRRNQMLPDEAADLLVLTDTNVVQVKEGPKSLLSSEEQAELQRLDFYYKELEGMFLPKLGRRSVQTIVVGGNRLQEAAIGSTRRASTLLFSHTLKPEEEAVQNAIAGVNTNAFSRTSAQLVAKRDHILQARGNGNGNGNGNGEVQYQKHTPSSKASQAPALKAISATGILEDISEEQDPEGEAAEDGAKGAEDRASAADRSETASILAARKNSRRNSELSVSFSGDTSANNSTIGCLGIPAKAAKTPPRSRQAVRTPSSSAPSTPKGSASKAERGTGATGATETKKQSPLSSQPGSPLSMSTSALREWFARQQLPG